MLEHGSYDTSRVRDVLHRRVVGLARIVDMPFDRFPFSVAIVPDDAAHNPIFVRVVDDEAIIWFGSGAQIRLGWGAEGDEDDILDMVDAVITGNATETAGLHPDDGRLLIGCRVVGKKSVLASVVDIDVVPIRQIPAW